MNTRFKWLLLLLLFVAPAYAQNVRVDNVTFSSVQGFPFLPGATITVCTAAATGLPCSPTVTGTCLSISDATCNQSATITSDPLGNYGFWIQPGSYSYTVTKAGFGGFGPKALTLPCQPASTCTITGAQTVNANLTVSGTGTFTGSAGTRTFSNPVFGTFVPSTPYRFVDSSADSTDAAAQGNTHYLPYEAVEVNQHGAGLALPKYCAMVSDSTLASNSPTLNGEATCELFFTNLVTPARNSGEWGTINVVGSNSQYTITTITCAAGTATFNTSVAHNLQAGDGALISSNSVAAYNGLKTLVTASGTSGTFAVTCGGTGNGGRIGIDSLFVGFEANDFNNLGDPGAPTTPDTMPARTRVGVYHVNLGTYPLHFGFLSDFNSQLSVAPYIGFISRGAQVAHFQSGFPCNVISATCAVDPATYSFLTKYNQVSSAGTPLVSSFKDALCDSAFSAGSQENCFSRQMVPTSQAIHTLNELYNTTVIGGLTNAGDHFVISRYCANPTANTCATGSAAGDITAARSATLGFLQVGSDGNGSYGRNGANMVLSVPAGGSVQAEGGTIPVLGIGATAGWQVQRNVAGCTTAASIGGICATPITVTWGHAYADTNYTVHCTANGAPTALPGTPYIASKLAGSVTVNYFAITAAAASWPSIDCTAIHD